MSMNDMIELLKKTKVSKDFPIDSELLKKGFIECMQVIQSAKVPEEDLSEVAKIVSELLSSNKDNY